ncbi:hypothetical protein HUT16_05005 [Kitasatospora sp. NA04385]|uniref:DUF7691 family protein n=1 Tax=Kitasatospora sp. NA04385 TaxID=2742135 RepID=UPI001592403C|nr:hypothetical protein [Kitasatospora sp. NA04385]QKW18510.1 hypothetical protein HUT16_05005 [Kitasatospora sp. NA04385]
MSTSIEHSTGDWAEVLALFGAGDDLTDFQRACLDEARSKARDHHPGRDVPLPVPDALEHLVAGRADSTVPYAGNSYQRALHLLVSSCGSDVLTLATHSSPESVYRALDGQLAAAGVPAELLPCAYLYGDPPKEFPVLPHSTDSYPALGHLPISRTKPAADAYRAVLDRVDPGLRPELERLTELLEIEHSSWGRQRDEEWYPRLTVFFYLG